MRKSFVLHVDSLEILKKLDNEQAGKLFKAINSYAKNKTIDCDFQTELLLFPFQKQFDRDNEAYSKTVERNKINGSKGGRPKKPKVTQKNPKEPTGLNGLQEKPKKADNDSDSDSDSDNKNKRSSRFAPPSLSEVINYCNERSNFVSPQGFLDHYQANGWMRGRNKIKDWKACVRTWEKNSNQNNSNKPIEFSETTRQNIINAEAFLNG